MRKCSGNAIFVRRAVTTVLAGAIISAVVGLSLAGLVVYTWSNPRLIGFPVEEFVVGTYIAVCIGVGFFVGRRLPERGYAYGMMPVALVTIVVRSILHRHKISWIWGSEVLISVLLAALGGWAGGRSVQRHRTDATPYEDSVAE